MATQRPNIKKHIDSQPKQKLYLANGKQPAQPKSMIEAMIPMAQKFVEDMDAKYKWGIAGLVYIVLTGVGTNLWWIYKLITTQLF